MSGASACPGMIHDSNTLLLSQPDKTRLGLVHSSNLILKVMLLFRVVISAPPPTPGPDPQAHRRLLFPSAGI